MVALKELNVIRTVDLFRFSMITTIRLRLRVISHQYTFNRPLIYFGIVSSKNKDKCTASNLPHVRVVWLSAIPELLGGLPM